MRGLWLFIHVIGFTLWLGGGIATMVAGVSAKSFDPGPRLASYRLIGNIQRLLVGPGAMPGWLNLMMGAGLLGALAAVGISVPTAARMGRLELDARGEMPESFQGLRKRQIMAASIAGGLGLVAMAAATFGRS